MKSHLAIARIATLIVGFAALPAHAQTAWTPLDHAPVARFSLAVTAGPDGRIYAFGGHYGSVTSSYIPLAHAEVFDPSANPAIAPAWNALPPMPTARAGASAVVATGSDGKPRIFVIGGIDGSGVLHSVEAYNPATRTWSSHAAMPTARAYLAAATGHDGRIYAIGGIATTSGGQGLSTVEVYDPGHDAWLAPPPGGFAAMPTARYAVASTLGHDGRIYVLGGRPGGQSSLTLRVVEAYDPATNTWASLPAMARVRYYAAAVTGLDGRLFAIGGYEPGSGDGELADVEVFDGTAWTTAPASLTMPRHALGAAVDRQGRLYAVGGYRGGEVNQVERLAP